MTDLWVLPSPSHSAWFAKIDWYLNWQMCKGLAHETRRPSVELLRLSEENGVPWFDPPKISEAPLLVAAKGRIPALGCMVLEGEPALKAWLRRAHALAGELKVSSLRVFLPIGFTVNEATQAWRGLPKLDIQTDFTPDEESAAWPTQSKLN